MKRIWAALMIGLVAAGLWAGVSPGARAATTGRPTVAVSQGVERGTAYYERVVTSTGSTVRTVRTYDHFVTASGSERVVWATVRYHRTPGGRWGLNAAYHWAETTYPSGRYIDTEVWVGNGVRTTEVDQSGHDGPTSITTSRVATVP